MSEADAPTRTSRGAATAARLTAAARIVFGRLGFTAARVEDITAEAGVSHGTFYTYFENKSAVLDAVVSTTADLLRAVAEDPWDAPDPRAAVRSVIERFIGVFAVEADVLRVWTEAAALEPHFRERLDEVRDDYVQRIADQLAPALHHTDHDPAVAAAALVAMVEGYTMQRFRPSSDEAREQAVRTLTDLWFGGIARLSLSTE